VEDLEVDASMFGNDVYVGVDKDLLKRTIFILGAREVARRLNIHRDTVESWYRKKSRSIPIRALRKICLWTNRELSQFKVIYIGGKGGRENWLPPLLGTPFAYLIGVIIGDGHLYETRVHIACDEITIKKAIVPCVKSLGFKYIVRSLKWNGNRWHTLEVNSRSLVWSLRDIFGIPIGKKAYKVQVPSLIKSSDFKIKTAFLRGLFDADGSISRRGRISFCSASRALHNDVVSILKSLGFTAYLRIDRRGKNPVYHLRIYRHDDVKRFSELIGFNAPEKLRRLTATVRSFR